MRPLFSSSMNVVAWRFAPLFTWKVRRRACGNKERVNLLLSTASVSKALTAQPQSPNNAAELESVLVWVSYVIFEGRIASILNECAY